MRVLVLDILLNQANDRKIPPDVLPRLFREYTVLAEKEAEGANSVTDYLKMKNGKEMKGSDKILKFRLTDGDRILYSYGKYFGSLRAEEADSLVLLGYAKHDQQDFFARNTQFFTRTDMVPVETLAADINDLAGGTEDDIFEFTDDDKYVIASFFDSDYIKKHSFAVISDEMFADLNPEEWDKYLSDEQNTVITEFISTPVPTLILGGAGTGKTLIGTHLIAAFNEENPKKQSCYFTQSYELRQKVIHDYKTFSQGDVNCCDINEYFLRINKKDKKHLIETAQFLDDFFYANQSVVEISSRNSLDPMDIWTEIRGVIKGSMDINWGRTSVQSQDNYEGSIKPLVDKGFFVRSKFNPKEFKLADSIPNLKEKATTVALTDCDKRNLKKAIKYFSSVDTSKKALTREEYLNLSDESSTIDIELRKKVYDIYLKYASYLDSNGFYDENDMALEAYEKTTDIDCLDFIFVDEVQDYTELQIFVINSLCRGHEIAFAGDAHQNVNPTLFREDRIKLLYNDENNQTSLKTVYLNKNFRCPHEVVQLTNTLAALRRKSIGKGKEESEQPGYSDRHGNTVTRLAYSDSALTSYVTVLSKYPGTVVLVPDVKTKTRLREKTGNKSVFTVSEIKGMEYSYVLCCDLFGTFADIWNRILKNGGASHKTKYRYYFNLVYVAATRAQTTLCFIDSGDIGEINKRLPLKNVLSYNRTDLYINQLTNQEDGWLKDAQQLEQNGKYEEAIESYKNAGELASVLDVYRCTAEMYRQKHDFKNATRYAIAAQKFDRAREFVKELPYSSNLAYLLSVIDSPSNISQNKGKPRISDIIASEFSSISDTVEENIYALAIKNMRTAAQNGINSVHRQLYEGAKTNG